MADIHILNGDGLSQWTLVSHFAVPDQSNSVDVNYRTALIVSGLGGNSSLAEGDGPGQITSAELAQIQAGAVYEHSVSFPAESGATNNTELLATVRAIYAQEQAATINRIQKQLRYYGYTGSAT